MTITFVGLDARECRWFGKVACRAAEELNGLLRPGAPERGLYAEFDTDAAAMVTALERHEDGQVIPTVVFAAGQWTSVGQAVPSAVRQLAAVLVADLPADEADSLRNVVESQNGALPRIRRRKLFLATDPRRHATLVVERDLPDDEFFRLVDALDDALRSAAAGEVTGSGCGAMGWSCDVASLDLDACLSCAADVFDRHGLPQPRVLK